MASLVARLVPTDELVEIFRTRLHAQLASEATPVLFEDDEDAGILVTPEYLRQRYPNVPRDAIIDRRIALAQRYAAIEGGLSAAAYSVAAATALETAGATLPAALVTFTADLLYTTRLQLRLAYDISVLYEHPADMNDPEDLYDLIRVAFGVKAGEALQVAAAKAAPEAVKQGVKLAIKGSTLAWLKALPAVGKYLLQRNIIKFSIPVVAIPLSVGINWWVTGSTARVARQVYRDKAAIDERVKDLVQSEVPALLLLKAVWLVLRADKKTSPEEVWLINDLTRVFELDEEGHAAVAEFKDIIDLKEDHVLAELGATSPEQGRLIYDAACYAAAVDHHFDPSESEVLQRLAIACRVLFDPKAVETLASDGLV